MPLNLSFFYSFSSITLYPTVLFHHTTLLTPTFICRRKKDERFFSMAVVLFLTHFSPHPVSCVFSPSVEY